MLRPVFSAHSELSCCTASLLVSALWPCHRCQLFQKHKAFQHCSTSSLGSDRQLDTLRSWAHWHTQTSDNRGVSIASLCLFVSYSTPPAAPLSSTAPGIGEGHAGLSLGYCSSQFYWYCAFIMSKQWDVLSLCRWSDLGLVMVLLNSRQRPKLRPTTNYSRPRPRTKLLQY